jgi:lipopolysaccharide transport system ATP-binding protein
VAAHLEPEVMIVDEVLAVGDFEFQRRCMGKMKEVHEGGRTVLFVSHNIPAVSALCTRVIVLEEGRKVFDGPTQEGIGVYLRSGEAASAVVDWENEATAPATEWVRLRHVSVRDADGRVTSSVSITERVGIQFEFDVLQPGQVIFPAFEICNETGTVLFFARETAPEWDGVVREVGRYRSIAWIPGNLLAPGRLTLNVGLAGLRPKRGHVVQPALVGFDAIEQSGPGTARGKYNGKHTGVVRPLLEWEGELLAAAGAMEAERR